MQNLFSRFPAEKKLPKLALFITALFTVAYFFLAHEGSYFYDDYFYSTYAQQIIDGTFQFDDMPFSHRFMVFLPLVVLYPVLGVSAYVTTFFTMLYTVGSLWLIYVTLHKKYPVACSWALVLMGFNFFTLFLSNYLYPDNILMFFALAAMVVLYRHRQGKWHFGVAAFLFVLANFCGMLAKETIVYLLPFYLYVFALDLVWKKHLKFWFFSAAIGVVLLAAYFLAYELLSGHYLNRFILSSEVVNEYKPGYLENLSGYLFKRLTYQPVLFFVGSGLILQVLFTIPAFKTEQFKHHLQLKSDLSFWLLATTFIFLQFWFGSTSYTHYKPMILVARMVSILMPPLCIVAGFGLQYGFYKRNWQLFFALSFGLSAVLAQSNLVVILGPIALYFLLIYFRPKLAIPVLGMLVVGGAMAIRPLHFMIKPSVTAFPEQQQVFLNRLNQPEGKYLVVADTFLVRQHPFFYRYKPNPNYDFLEYSTYKTSPPKTAYDTTFLLINMALLRNEELLYNFTTKPDSLEQMFPDKELLQQKDKVQLFYLSKE